MKYGLTPEQFQVLDTLVIQPLKQQGAEVFIFGSRVTEMHHTHSDVDILFRKNEFGAADKIKLTAIKEAIEESNFPFTVDLVEENDLAVSYRENIISTMKML